MIPIGRSLENFRVRGSVLGGIGILGLLITVAIILYLASKEFQSDPATGVSTQKMAMDRSKGAACSMNRQTLSLGVTRWAINHPGETPTVEALQQAGISVPRCPQGGEYIFVPNSQNIYCTVHDPPPGATPVPVKTPEAPTN
jgi:hypothetical protein